MKENNSIENRKKSIFDSMSKKRQKQILKKISYNKWNPFEEPKKPINIRMNKTKKNAHILVDKFLSSKLNNKKYNLHFKSLIETAINLINNDDCTTTIHNFSVWYEKYNQNIKPK